MSRPKKPVTADTAPEMVRVTKFQAERTPPMSTPQARN
jgi:hypothetical protein